MAYLPKLHKSFDNLLYESPAEAGSLKEWLKEITEKESQQQLELPLGLDKVSRG